MNVVMHNLTEASVCIICPAYNHISFKNAVLIFATMFLNLFCVSFGVFLIITIILIQSGSKPWHNRQAVARYEWLGLYCSPFCNFVNYRLISPWNSWLYAITFKDKNINFLYILQHDIYVLPSPYRKHEMETRWHPFVQK